MKPIKKEQNIINPALGDEVKFIKQNDTRFYGVLTFNKKYVIIGVKTDKYCPRKNAFQIKCNKGKKRWYSFRTESFEFLSNYSEKQEKLMKRFVREIEQALISWQINSEKDKAKADAMYKERRDYLINEYLTELNK